MVTKEELIYLYLEKNYSREMLQKHFNLSRSTIYKLLKKYNIRKSKIQIQQDKIKNNINKYGVSHPRKNKKINNKINNKIKQTCNDKYNVEYFTQDINIINKIKETCRFTCGKKRDIKQKLQIFNVQCLQLFDFYIPELDLYIDYHVYIEHGKEPFNPNKPEHLAVLRKWVEKAQLKPYNSKNKYLYYIKTWTQIDVEKRLYVKQNNLNYIEFFTQQEFENWYKKSKS